MQTNKQAYKPKLLFHEGAQSIIEKEGLHQLGGL